MLLLRGSNDEAYFSLCHHDSIDVTNTHTWPIRRVNLATSLRQHQLNSLLYFAFITQLQKKIPHIIAIAIYKVWARDHIIPDATKFCLFFAAYKFLVFLWLQSKASDLSACKVVGLLAFGIK